jgi:hypothetical protein
MHGGTDDEPHGVLDDGWVRDRVDDALDAERARQEGDR